MIEVDGIVVDGITEHIARRLASFDGLNPDAHWTSFVREARTALAATREFQLSYTSKAMVTR